MKDDGGLRQTSPHRVLVLSCFVAFVVDVTVLLLEVELDPVMKTHDLLAKLRFSNKHVLEPAGILPEGNNTSSLHSNSVPPGYEQHAGGPGHHRGADSGPPGVPAPSSLTTFSALH